MDSRSAATAPNRATYRLAARGAAPRREAFVGTRFPYGLPIGWFAVADGRSLVPGSSLVVRYLARDLSVSRAASGAASVVEASGALEGQAWPVVERGPFVFVWHHPSWRPPTWHLPEVAEAIDPGWSPFRVEQWRLRTSVQELGENQVDAAHFVSVHRSVTVPVMHAEARDEVLHVRSVNTIETPAGAVRLEVDLRSCGLGFGAMRAQGAVASLLVGCATPIDEEVLHLRFALSVRNAGPILSDVVLQSLAAALHTQVEEDRPIWEHKVYVEPPLLVAGDGPIGVYRAWVRQFYAGATP